MAEGGNENTVTLFVRDQAGENVLFELKKTTPMSKVYDAYARRKGVMASSLRFLLDGKEVDRNFAPILMEKMTHQTQPWALHVATKQLHQNAPLTSLPESVLERIFQYMNNAQDLLAIELTCRDMFALLANDGVWGRICAVQGLRNSLQAGDSKETRRWISMATMHPWPTRRERVFIPFVIRNMRREQKHTDNILLDVLGGADGFRRLADGLLDKLGGVGSFFETSTTSFHLRGDSIGYLSELVQEYLLRRLRKAVHYAVKHAAGRYPKVTKESLVFLGELELDEIPPRNGKNIPWWQCDGSWRCKALLNETARFRMIRRMAYKAGVVKITGEAISYLAEETLGVMAGLLRDAYSQSCNDMSANQPMDEIDKVDDEMDGTKDTSNAEEEADGVFENENLDMYNQPPPALKDDGGKEVWTIIPRYIKNAASRAEIRITVMGGSYVLWAPCEGRTVEEEMEEAEMHYEVDDASCDNSMSVQSSESEDDSVGNFCSPLSEGYLSEG